MKINQELESYDILQDYHGVWNLIAWITLYFLHADKVTAQAVFFQGMLRPACFFFFSQEKD